MKSFFGLPAPESEISVEIREDVNNNFELFGSVGNRSPYLMYYSLQMFFDNGGGECWIVSVGDYSTTVIDQGDLIGGLNTTEQIDEITLYVFPDAQGLGSATEYYDLYESAIAMCVKLQDRFTVMDVWYDPGLPEDQWRDNIDTLRSELAGNVDDLKYAAAYYPNLETTINLYYGGEGVGDSRVSITHTGGDGSLAGPLSDLISKNNALYFRARSAINAIPTILPPSPAMVGIYASVDASRGVWKAPANVGIRFVEKPVRLLTDAEQAGLNIDSTAGKSINVIRSFKGRGILVWGARTLAGNDNEWRYISVRRFFNMVEESTKNATFQFVFEPNDLNTWTRVKSMIENFLTRMWLAGALQGATTEQAYYVAVGLGETMTQLDILEGRMIVEIGMAVVRPAEFIILQFSHKMIEA